MIAVRMAPAALVEAALAGTIDRPHLSDLARDAGSTPPALLEALAIDVARRYIAGAMSFDDGDVIMNAAFAAWSDADFLGAPDGPTAPAVLEVYRAFDEGEYRHPGDADNVDLEAQYTRPLIREFLARIVD